MSTSSGWSANRLGRNASMPAIWTGAPIICWARAPAAPAGCVTQRAFGHPQPGDVLDGPDQRQIVGSSILIGQGRGPWPRQGLWI